MAEHNLNAAEEPRNPHVRHELGDVNARSVTKFGIAMAFLILVFLFALAGLFRFFAKSAAEIQPPVSPMGVLPKRVPPDPRLQPNPSLDMRAMRADEDRMLHQYAWLDQDKGIVRIPVDRAMDLILQRGLLSMSAPSGAPASAPVKTP